MRCSVNSAMATTASPRFGSGRSSDARCGGGYRYDRARQGAAALHAARPPAGRGHRPGPVSRGQPAADRGDRKSTRLTPVTNAQLVCRLLLEKKTKKRQKTSMYIN